MTAIVVLQMLRRTFVEYSNTCSLIDPYATHGGNWWDVECGWRKCDAAL